MGALGREDLLHLPEVGSIERRIQLPAVFAQQRAKRFDVLERCAERRKPGSDRVQGIVEEAGDALGPGRHSMKSVIGRPAYPASAVMLKSTCNTGAVAPTGSGSRTLKE